MVNSGNVHCIAREAPSPLTVTQLLDESSLPRGQPDSLRNSQGVGDGMNWEVGIDIRTRLCIK